MTQRFKNYLKLGLLFFGISCFVMSCQKDDSIKQTEHSGEIQDILSRTLDLQDIPHFNTVNEKLKNIHRHLNTNSSGLQRTLNADSTTIITDNVLYMTYDDSHTYTFKLFRTNPEYYIENLVLHFNTDTQDYDEYLLQYDITDQEFLDVSDGQPLSDTANVLISELDQGTFSIILNRSDCFRVCETICVPCTSELEHGCDEACEYDPSDDRAAFTYQSCGTICIDTTPTETIDAGDSSGGGGGKVVTNPNTEEPCTLANGQVGIVAPNGDCVKKKELDTDQPLIDQKNCEELNKLTLPRDPDNQHPLIGGENKNIRDALLGMGDEIVASYENGYALVNSGNYQSPPDGHGPFALNLDASADSHVYLPKNEQRAFGVIHTHMYNGTNPLNALIYTPPMFSLDDIATLSVMKNNYVPSPLLMTEHDDSVFVMILSVKIDNIVHTYAIKISDLAKFQEFNTMRSDPLKYKEFDNALKSKYDNMMRNSNPNISASAYEKTFLKFVSNYNGDGYDVGIDTFKMEINNTNNSQGFPTTEIKWKKLSLSTDGNSVESTDPCN